MKEEFNLSDKVWEYPINAKQEKFIREKDVKEFIRLLKKEFGDEWIFFEPKEIIQIINNYAGKELT